jgi:hypothetical protein
MTMICPHCQHVTTSGKYCQDCGLPLPPPAGGNTGDIVAIGSTIIAGNTVIAAGDWPGTRVVAECPKCGTRNDVDKTFKCKRCGVDNLCLRHLNHDFDLCEYCVQASIESRKGRTTGIRIGRRAALVGAGGFGAISLAWLTLKGGDLFGLAPPVPPIATPTATNPSPTSTPNREDQRVHVGQLNADPRAHVNEYAANGDLHVGANADALGHTETGGLDFGRRQSQSHIGSRNPHRLRARTGW